MCLWNMILFSTKGFSGKLICTSALHHHSLNYMFCPHNKNYWVSIIKLVTTDIYMHYVSSLLWKIHLHYNPLKFYIFIHINNICTKLHNFVQFGSLRYFFHKYELHILTIWAMKAWCIKCYTKYTQIQTLKGSINVYYFLTIKSGLQG